MKFVKRLSLFLLLFVVGAALFACDNTGGGTGDGGGTEQPEELIVEIKNLKDQYEFNTGDAFSKEILLAGVEFVDQKGNDYSEYVTIAGLDAIPVNDDGTLKQSGTYNLRLSVIVGGNAVATEIIKVKVIYVAPVTASTFLFLAYFPQIDYATQLRSCTGVSKLIDKLPCCVFISNISFQNYFKNICLD